MVKIVIENLGGKEVTANDLTKSALAILQSHSIDWRFECGAKGRSTTCKMIILRGEENLSPVTAVEQSFRNQGALRLHERLACQARVVGNIIIKVPEEGKLPHIIYHL